MTSPDDKESAPNDKTFRFGRSYKIDKHFEYNFGSTTNSTNPSTEPPTTMPMPDKILDPEDAKQMSLFQYAKAYGENPLPPTLLATLITAQHMRPFQVFPMLFPPILLFSSYLNVQGFKKDSAGLTSAWSMAYFVLASRRKVPITRKFGARGITRGATMALCVANAVGGGWAYWRGKKEEEGKD